MIYVQWRIVNLSRILTGYRSSITNRPMYHGLVLNLRFLISIALCNAFGECEFQFETPFPGVSGCPSHSQIGEKVGAGSASAAPAIDSSRVYSRTSGHRITIRNRG